MSKAGLISKKQNENCSSIKNCNTDGQNANNESVCVQELGCLPIGGKGGGRGMGRGGDRNAHTQACRLLGTVP